MLNDFITLVAKTYEKDTKGVSRSTESLNENVPALVKSAGSQEYFEGGRNGLNPQFEFTIRTIDYAGEETAIYEGIIVPDQFVRDEEGNIIGCKAFRI